MILRVIGDDAQTVVATVAEGGPNDIAAVLPRFAVERKHHLGMVSVRVAGAVVVAHHKLARFECLFRHTGLVGPRAREMAHPDIAPSDGQIGRGKACERHVSLFPVGYFCPHLYHVYIVVGPIFQIHDYRIHRILQVNGRDSGIALLLHIHTRGHKVGGKVAVGMAHGQCRLGRRVESVGRIDLHAPACGNRQGGQVGIGQPRSEVDILRMPAVFGIHHQREVLRLDFHHSGGKTERTSQKQTGE